MEVRFTKHAIQRLKQRFPTTIDQLIRILDQGLRTQNWIFVQDHSRAIDGTIHGRPVRVVFMKGLLGGVTVITAMWRTT